MENKYLKIIMTILLISLIPLVSAYRLNIPMPSLWDALVEYGFGGFVVTLVMLMFLITIILAIGGISFWTTLLYNVIFLIFMTTGYGYRLVAILWVMVLSVWAIMSVVETFKRQGGG